MTRLGVPDPCSMTPAQGQGDPFLPFGTRRRPSLPPPTSSRRSVSSMRKYPVGGARRDACSAFEGPSCEG